MSRNRAPSSGALQCWQNWGAERLKSLSIPQPNWSWGGSSQFMPPNLETGQCICSRGHLAAAPHMLETGCMGAPQEKGTPEGAGQLLFEVRLTLAGAGGGHGPEIILQTMPLPALCQTPGCPEKNPTGPSFTYRLVSSSAWRSRLGGRGDKTEHGAGKSRGEGEKKKRKRNPAIKEALCCNGWFSFSPWKRQTLMKSKGEGMPE